jgi:hypothetical protein
LACYHITAVQVTVWYLHWLFHSATAAYILSSVLAILSLRAFFDFTISFNIFLVVIIELYSFKPNCPGIKVKTKPAFYLLIFYTLAMCKPVLPLVQDELAHIFWKAQHIATVHHYHGDHHAEVEIAEAAHEEENNKLPATSKTPEPVSIHITSPIVYNIQQPILQKEKYSIITSNVSTVSLDKHYPPPKSC